MIEVRAISEEDIVGFHQALDAVARERRYLLLLEAPPLEAVEGFVRGNIEQNIAQFVALDGGRVIGWCDIRPRPVLGMEHTGDLGMGVLEAYRGRGIGTRLLEATVAQAFANGLLRVELEAFSSNQRSIALYEKCGFQHEGVKKKARYIDGCWDDFIVMARFNDAWSEPSEGT